MHTLSVIPPTPRHLYPHRPAQQKSFNHLLSEANLNEWQAAVEEGEKILGAADRAHTIRGEDKPN